MRQIERVVVAALAGVVVSSAAAQDAVQWRVEDGGNGHWYLLNTSPLGWDSAMNFASQIGGHGATIHSEAENEFVYELAVFCCNGIWLGGVGRDGECTDREAYEWITGEPMTFSAWRSDEPNGWPGSSSCAISYHPDYPGDPRWNDMPRTTPWDGPSVIEWSADCNGDGIVDYGQILDGTFADTDGNGVPDCCDADEACDPCIGDLNGDGVVGPPDLGILLAVWGTDGGDIVAADINGDGTVNASDLGPLLGAWGACP